MKMGFSRGTQGFILILAALSLLATASEAKTIIVGGSENWRSGVNYTDWSLKNRPFFIKDSLVFKYDPPSENTTAYSVYLLPNFRSYVKCDFKGAKLLANSTQGSGDGFAYELSQWRPHYFASGEASGSQCKDGMMKFSVLPWSRWN